MSTTTPKLLSVKEAANRLGVSPSLVYQWCTEKRLPHIRLGRAHQRGKILLEEQDVLAFLTAARIEAGEETSPAELTHITRK